MILSKGRIRQGMKFLETAKVDVDIGAMGIRSGLPVLDRHSPLSYAIVQQCPYPVCGKAGKAENQSCRDSSWLLRFLRASAKSREMMLKFESEQDFEKNVL